MQEKLFTAITGTIALVAGFLFVSGAAGLPLDDAYIHLAFAKNLAAGNGLCFNPGEFSLGFSSPLWIGVLALIKAAGGDLVTGARIISVLAFSASCALVFLITVRSLVFDTLSKYWTYAAGLTACAGVFLSGNMLWLAGAGMEPFIFLSLGLGAIVLVSSERPKPIVAGMLLALAGLTRTSSLALIIIVFAVLLFSSRRSVRSYAGIAVAVLPPALWLLFSFLKTGHLIPQTRAGKLAADLFNTGLSAKGAALYAWRHLAHLWLHERGIVIMAFFGLAALLLVLGLYAADKIKSGNPKTGPRHSKRAAALSPAHILGIWFLLHFAAHMLFFRSAEIITPYHNLRYHPMLFPAIYSLAAVAVWYVAVKMNERIQSRAVPAAAILVLCAPLVIQAFNVNTWRTYYLRNTDQLQEEHKKAAEWAANFLEKDARIACLDVGILGFYSGRYIIDLGGLIDPSVNPWLEKGRVGPYLVEKNATHYFAIVRHDSERITGVKREEDYGRLYRLGLMERFHYPYYPRPVFLHSLGINIYKILPPEKVSNKSEAGRQKKQQKEDN